MQPRKGMFVVRPNWLRPSEKQSREISILKCSYYDKSGASQVALVVKNLPASAGDIKDLGSIPGSGRCPGRGHDNPLQYSYLEKSMDRGAWCVTVHGVTKSRT